MIGSLISYEAERLTVGEISHNAAKKDRKNIHYYSAIKASCIDSTASAEAVFAAEVQKLREEHFKPLEQLTLEPYERDHAVVTGEYRPNA